MIIIVILSLKAVAKENIESSAATDYDSAATLSFDFFEPHLEAVEGDCTREGGAHHYHHHHHHHHHRHRGAFCKVLVFVIIIAITSTTTLLHLENHKLHHYERYRGHQNS